MHSNYCSIAFPTIVSIEIELVDSGHVIVSIEIELVDSGHAIVSIEIELVVIVDM